MRLLLVEDDPKIAEFVLTGFAEQAIDVCWEPRGDSALQRALAESFDIAVIDLMLPGLDGLELIRTLRRQGQRLPILILSAKSSVEERVQGLEQGSDDYLTKPFAFSELQARVQALLRRHQPRPEAPAESLQLADLHLDLLKKKVTRAGTLIRLQPRELALLEYLLRNRERVISKNMILEQVWDYSFDPQTNVVDVLVCRLRSKIDKHFSPKLLHTLRGVGYVLKVED